MSASAATATATHRMLGVGFLSLLLFFGWGTYAIFTKKFVDYVPVTLKTSKIGLQLPVLADVKIRGVIVGDVREIEADGHGATLHLALDPDRVQIVPANVTARILPKTLFGEKYVELEVPADPAADPIAAGARIEQSEVGIEVERLLADLNVLLRTVQPAEINYTLTAIATALEGRGGAIGANFETLDRYLKRVNPQIPLLVDDLVKLGQVSETYRQVVPDLARLLRNSVTTGGTLRDNEDKVVALFDDVAGFSSTSRDFLERNGENIIRLSEQGQQQLPLFARYAPEYPCLLQNMVNWVPQMEQTYRGYTLHITLETIPRQPRGYDVRDDPVFAEDRGPIGVEDCRAAPSYDQGRLPGNRYAPNLATGVDYPLGKRVAPGPDLTSGFAGTAAERWVVNAIAARAMGVGAGEVPDVATLLFGPLARGTEVSLR